MLQVWTRHNGAKWLWQPGELHPQMLQRCPPSTLHKNGQFVEQDGAGGGAVLKKKESGYRGSASSPVCFQFGTLVERVACLMPTSLGQTKSSSTSRHVFSVSAEDHNSSRKTFEGEGGGLPAPFTDGNDVPLEPTFGSNDLVNSLVLQIAQHKQNGAVDAGKQAREPTTSEWRSK